MNTATVLRWSARLLSILILLFWGFFIVAHLGGDEGRPSRPLDLGDYILMASIGVSLVGLLAAWKWELAGGLATLVAYFVAAAVNWNLFVFPMVLIPITAALFLIRSWVDWNRHPKT